MSLIAAAAVWIVFQARTDQTGPQTWQIAYSDGVVEERMTPGPVLDLSLRPCYRATVRVKGTDGTWSLDSAEMVYDPVPGDFNYDGAVGVPDYAEWATRFGAQCGD